ncbi:photosystem II protein PsbQ [Merismopedia glauca]|uniref:Photosystem II protein PsbQ n=1 Tax=Merismopedia glauca CCAP 1448/3 TaxID=1296344 RepID=A0A2T1C3J7_9CYAN|nr:photosystem II protein PsbQ [Merismopedia glauca]PSB02842.1 photosystem II protein PsbQ [Merismopedia glauca CCAP 1448/3]
MIRYRSILNVLIVLVAVLVVSCGGPAAKAPTYSTQQIQQFQQYSSRIAGFGDRLSELQTLVDGKKWNDVRSFIHGPLGDLRLQMVNLSRELFPDAKAKALAQSKDVFNHLVKIDEAAQSGNYELASRNVSEVVEDIKAFLQLVPQG